MRSAVIAGAFVFVSFGTTRGVGAFGGGITSMTSSPSSQSYVLSSGTAESLLLLSLLVSKTMSSPVKSLSSSSGVSSKCPPNTPGCGAFVAGTVGLRVTQTRGEALGFEDGDGVSMMSFTTATGDLVGLGLTTATGDLVGLGLTTATGDSVGLGSGLAEARTIGLELGLKVGSAVFGVTAGF